MTTIAINVPALITVENIGNKVETFIPKGENFHVNIAAGKKIEFIADTAEKVFYYLGQASTYLTVTQEAVGE